MTLHFILQSHCGVDWVPAGTTHFTKVTLQCWPPKLLVRTTYFAKVTLQCHPPKYWQNFAEVTLQCQPPKYRQGQHTLPKSHCSVDHPSTSKYTALCQSHTAVSTTWVQAGTTHFAEVTLQCRPPKYQQGHSTLLKSHCSVDHPRTSKDTALCQSHTAVSTTQVPARTQHFAKVTLQCWPPKYQQGHSTLPKSHCPLRSLVQVPGACYWFFYTPPGFV